MAERTMTAPKAVIKNQKGQVIGLVRNLRLSETFQRGSVRGVGTIYESERPILSFNGTWSCDQYLIDLNESGIKGLDNRNVPSTKIYEQTKILLEETVDIVIARKEIDVLDENGNVVEVEEGEFATVRDVYLDSMNFDITEGAISGFTEAGVYTKPVLAPIS